MYPDPGTRYLNRHILSMCFILSLSAISAYSQISPSAATQPGAGSQAVNQMPAAYGSNIPVSFVRVWEATRPFSVDTMLNGTTRISQEVKQSTQYFDGLGRPLQTVVKGASPKGFDLVSPVVYDVFGREIFKYLPYISATSTGNFKTDAFNEQNNFMSGIYNPTNDAIGEKFFYSRTDVESSPLGRALKTYAPGNSWVGDAVGVEMQYSVNTAADSVRIWNIGNTSDNVPASPAAYATGQLYKTITIDESGNKVIEYKDKTEHVILKKVQVATAAASGHTGWLCTYYVYDELSNLRFVLQPKATEWLKTNNWVFDNTVWNNSTVAKELCFSYEYDARKRMIIKRVPGVGEVWMVYDKRDRLVMTQDSVLRLGNWWLYTDYDSLNRPVITGKMIDLNEREALQSLAAESITYPSPNSHYTILTQTYYDNYGWVNGGTGGFTTTACNTYNGNTSYFYTPDNNTFPYPQAQSATNLTRGMVTGSKTNVIGSSTYLYAISFYDDRARLIQTQSTNNRSGRDTTVLQYSFSGQVLRTLMCHEKGGANAQKYKILTKTSYDAGGRITQLNRKTGNSPEVIIASNEYDELGQLKKKKLGQVRNTGSQNTYSSPAVFLDSMQYSYNVRGWIRGINKDYARNENGAVAWFGMELCYDFGFTASQLNGNIAGMRWRNGSDGQQRAYGFGYDAVNRLTKADFTQYASANTWDISAGINYSVRSLTYDPNGNITGMSQFGLKLGSSIQVDSLIYGYNASSNKLNYVTDKKNDTTARLGDFAEISNNTTQDYWYDGNGNLTKDNNKNISSIVYNYLNLPSVITITSKGTITYTYDATGNKLKKVTVDNTVSPSRTTTTDYLGLFIYQNDTLQFVTHEEGRVRPALRVGYSDTMYYDYFEKDHLGNIRVMITDQLQTDAYIVASLESAQLSNERKYYDRVDSGRVALPSGYPSDGYTNPNAYTQKLRGTAVKVGTSMLLKVMAGDKISVRVNSWYNLNGTTPTGTTSPVTDLINALISSIPGESGNKILQNQLNTTVLNPSVTGFLSTRDAGNVSTKPKAYLNIVLLDEQLKPVITNDGKNSYFEQVNASNVLEQHTSVVNRPITKSGYLYIYVSNETNNIDVFFDNLHVTHIRGLLLETTDYYPFGLTMAGISSKALYFGTPENKCKFTSQLLDDDLGWNTYQMKWRTMDLQIGRFLQIDPLACQYVHNSTYAYAENDVIRAIDLEGMEKLITTSLIRMSVDYNSRLHRLGGASVHLNMQNVSSATRQVFTSAPSKPGTIGGASSNIGNIVYKPQAIKTQSDAGASDIKQPKSIGQPDVNIPNIPKNKKELHQIERSKNFEITIAGTSGAVKADAMMAVIEMATQGMLYNIDRIVNGDIKAAQGQAFAALSTFNDIQAALSFDLVPQNLQNSSSLTSFANYLLYGELPTLSAVVTQTANGEVVSFPVDNNLVRQFNAIMDNLKKAQNAKPPERTQ